MRPGDDLPRATILVVGPDGAPSELGKGILVYERGVIMLPGTAQKFDAPGKADDTLVCRWDPVRDDDAVIRDSIGIGEAAAPAKWSTSLVGVNLAERVPKALRRNLPYPKDQTIRGDAYAQALLDLINGTVSDEEVREQPAKKPPWCWLFPNCPGC